MAISKSKRLSLVIKAVIILDNKIELYEYCKK